MKKLILILALVSVSGCSTVMSRYEANQAREVRKPWVQQPTYRNKYGYEVYADGTFPNPADKERTARAEYDEFSKSVGAPTLAERNQSSPENPQQTACIYYGNAYVQAINIRNQWSFADPKDSYNAALNHVQAILSKYPQFSAKAIVDNVFYNPNFRYPVGGNPLSLQMTQLCMKETKQASFKP